MPWFSRGGILNSAADPNSYTLVGGTAPTCTGSRYVCSINAANDGTDKPIIDQPLLEEIIQTLENRVNSVNVGLKNS